jgi:hypothetical protein
MDETIKNENAYSKERLETASIQAPAEVIKVKGNAEGGAGAPTANLPRRTQVEAIADSVRFNWPKSFAELPQFLKRTRQVWLTMAGVVAGVVAMVAVVQHASDWIKNRRERRQEQAVATVTPERLIARCGNAAQDETKEVYPIVMRTMSYQPSGHEKLVVSFSRTAEEQSDWVFLSMQDENGVNRYDTPEAKIAALPCLDSRK